MDNKNPIEPEMANGSDDTGSGAKDPATETQGYEVQMSQAQLDDIIAKRISKATAKTESAVRAEFEGVDVNEWNAYKQRKEASEGEDKKTARTIAKLEAELAKAQDIIGTRNARLEKSLFDGELNKLANNLNITAIDIVAQQLKPYVKIDFDNEEVEIMDANGNPRFTSNGDPMGLKDLTEEFLGNHPMFVKAAPSGAGTSSNVAVSSKQSFDLSDLDPSNPEHQKMYQEWRGTKF